MHEEADWEAECGIDELIGDYGTVRFEQGGRVTFALAGLPHAITACGMDLYTAPLSELAPFLAATAGDYFPAVAD